MVRFPVQSHQGARYGGLHWDTHHALRPKKEMFVVADLRQSLIGHPVEVMARRTSADLKDRNDITKGFRVRTRLVAPDWGDILGAVAEHHVPGTACFLACTRKDWGLKCAALWPALQAKCGNAPDFKTVGEFLGSGRWLSVNENSTYYVPSPDEQSALASSIPHK